MNLTLHLILHLILHLTLHLILHLTLHLTLYLIPKQRQERQRLLLSGEWDESDPNNMQEFPETVAVTLWGLDAIKTKGESIGILLALVGAVPVREGTGRIVNFDLIPLAELGRPRIDVLASLSGIFRDTFSNVLDLVDDLVRVRIHTLSLTRTHTTHPNAHPNTDFKPHPKPTPQPPAPTYTSNL